MTRDMLIDIAKEAATCKNDHRNFMIGAAAIRSDGTVVRSYNGPVIMYSETHKTFPQAHAEARLSRKLDKGSVVFVCRVRTNGEFAMAKPCPDCMRALAARGVKKVYYTVDDNRIESHTF